MIGVVFDPAALNPDQKQWWQSWQHDADNATAELIRSFEDWFSGDRKEPFKFKFKQSVWKSLRDWFLANVFYGKCAYCEFEILRQPGDAEHFRPKGAVKSRDVNGKIVDAFCESFGIANGDIERMLHPGYFWLAYDWRNLLPSCSDCNKGPGKKTRFDVDKQNVFLVELNGTQVAEFSDDLRPRASRWAPFYYPSVAILDQMEGPLLLNPLNPCRMRDPRQHITFGRKGSVSPINGSAIGETSIEVFNLREERLRIARQTAQENFWREYCDALKDLDPNTNRSMAADLIDKYESGRKPFSAAVLDYRLIMKKAMP